MNISKQNLLTNIEVNNLIILGPSGSGKGTQAELLARKFGLKVLDGGEYLRKLMASKASGSARIAAKYNRGKLSPTDIVKKWIKEQIFSEPISKGLIFSGQPRMISEAKLTYKWFQESGRGKPLIIFLKVSTREVLKRLKKRYICSKCKKVYTLDAPPKKSCKICGGEIIKRADDTPKSIKNRLAYFKIQVAQTLKFFKKKGILIEVNGEQSVEEVHKEIVRKIEKFMSVNDCKMAAK
ncbi:MAG: nucleoside monophosphate kinase [Patescibacteria group bacterium]